MSCLCVRSRKQWFYPTFSGTTILQLTGQFSLLATGFGLFLHLWPMVRKLLLNKVTHFSLQKKSKMGMMIIETSPLIL
jgi:hypothetical protein